jgi:hypothetical protein
MKVKTYDYETVRRKRVRHKAGWWVLRTRKQGQLVGPLFRRILARKFRVKIRQAGTPSLVRRKLYALRSAFTPAQGSDRITREDLRDVLEAAFPVISPTALRPSEDFDDLIYYLPTEAEVCHVFGQRSSLDRDYLDEVLDCEDFAYSLRADFAFNRYRVPGSEPFYPMAVGMVWAGPRSVPHCLNVAVTTDSGVLLLDSTPLAPRDVYPVKMWGQRPVNYIVI